MPRPRGGDWLEDEIKALQDCGVNVLVSLLTADEASELELSDEKKFCDQSGIELISFPINDRNIPSSSDECSGLIRTLDARLSNASNVAVHCRMGIGRSAMIVAALIVQQGVTVEEAFMRISTSRGFDVPDTQEQFDWVAQLSQDL
ncbi:MAG: tyrosine protein phosphatase [Planctomycetaceae bacterium]|nr:tyrosine protein phosphatase [Planctomycetaceae bacterium]MBT6157006.1 tyrosine protein phosphatase [Planctomycetaceae bacterium]MBT6484428.1 tyrosine protein phosphatase [Planctomycetaceae bacterium]MBT6494669.1 tyrosine protein phosphatase [Planctomycetaceae bacterium]